MEGEGAPLRRETAVLTLRDPEFAHEKSVLVSVSLPWDKSHDCSDRYERLPQSFKASRETVLKDTRGRTIILYNPVLRKGKYEEVPYPSSTLDKLVYGVARVTTDAIVQPFDGSTEQSRLFGRRACDSNHIFKFIIQFTGMRFFSNPQKIRAADLFGGTGAAEYGSVVHWGKLPLRLKDSLLRQTLVPPAEYGEFRFLGPSDRL